MKYPRLIMGLVALGVTIALLDGILTCWQTRDGKSTRQEKTASEGMHSSEDGHPAGRTRRDPARHEDPSQIQALLDLLQHRIAEGKSAEDLQTVLEYFFTAWQGSPSQSRLLALGLLDLRDCDPAARTALLQTFFTSGDFSRSREALDLLAELRPRLQTDGQLPEYAAAVIARVVSEDPQFTVDWLTRHTGDFAAGQADVAARALLARLAGVDPHLALSVLPSLPVTDLNRAVAAIALNVATPDGRNAVLEYLRRAGADGAGMATAQIMANLATAFNLRPAIVGASHDPATALSFETAVAWIDSAHLSPDETSGFISGLTSAWEPADNGKWVDWIASHADPAQAQEKAGLLVTSWTDRNPAEARQWIDSSTAGPVKDSAVTAFVETGLRTGSGPAFDGAFQVAMQHSDSPRRVQLLQQAIRKTGSLVSPAR